MCARTEPPSSLRVRLRDHLGKVRLVGWSLETSTFGAMTEPSTSTHRAAAGSFSYVGGADRPFPRRRSSCWAVPKIRAWILGEGCGGHDGVSWRSGGGGGWRLREGALANCSR